MLTGCNLQEVETREPGHQRVVPLHLPGFILTELSRIEQATVWISRYWKGAFIRFAFIFSLILTELGSCSLGPGGRHLTAVDDGVQVSQILRDQTYRIQFARYHQGPTLMRQPTLKASSGGRVRNNQESLIV